MAGRRLQHLLPPSFGAFVGDLTTYGPWALVTGASSGIGEAFARCLARSGLSLVLVARRRDRLEALGERLERENRIQVRPVETDLSVEASAERLADAVADLDVGLLVNNAGVGAMGRFGSHEPGRLADMIRLNCTAPVLLTHHMLPRLKARERAGIIVVSSVAAYQGSPYMACYSATKAFDLIFGEGLAAECRGTGLDVLVVSPGATETEFQMVAEAVPHRGDSADSVAEEALASLGRKHTVVTGVSHKLQAASGRFFPRRFVTWAAGKVLTRLTPPEKR